MRQDRTLIDTNILIYMFSPEDPSKRAKAIQAVRGLEKQGIVSTQVLQEFYWISTRKLRMNPLESKTIVAEFTEGEVVSTTPNLILDAIDLSIVSGFTIWDSLIVQAAIAGRCSRIFTADLNHGQVVKGIKIVNPLL